KSVMPQQLFCIRRRFCHGTPLDDADREQIGQISLTSDGFDRDTRAVRRVEIGVVAQERRAAAQAGLQIRSVLRCPYVLRCRLRTK
ncbi:MAG: hypothetical protein ACRDHZ_21270, partial [Ktedonobacteraceae bacterium]